MKVFDYITQGIGKGTMHMTLLDPAKQSPEEAAAIAKEAQDYGTDAIMVGGSTDITQENLDATVKAIKKVCSVPVIYFPSGAHAISRYTDAIYFMSMLNSRNVKMVVGEQVMGAPIVKALGLEPLSMGYIIVAPGMKVGEVGQADPIPRDDLKLACAYALAAEYMGMRLVYMEAGSGAPEPVPIEMVSAVKKTISVPLIIGGGIRRPEQAAAIARAGADIIVTGTIAEHDDLSALGSIIKAVKAR
ncbi:MAG: geranylgeranylglyceryl/heptaprenylglyceryl phosphate synthase [Methanomassiliicoccales archaeon]|nr:MAG: geranylgeranylglyceryl/heptaprenylglyceryl phosphate synthase [Methanomassiliicoccales archaeon]